jgi:hypothetical protein
MTDQQHPITPPPELVGQRASKSFVTQHFCTAAVQWGADQELKACCEWIHDWYGNESGVIVVRMLRAARRPKPPRLKEQALALVERHEDGWTPSPKDWDTIRRALEALPNA